MPLILRDGNAGQKIINNANAPPTGDTVFANYLWFWGKSLLLNIAVCLSYLHLVNGILDLVSYERVKFILSVTIVKNKQKQIKPSLKAIDRWWSSYANAVIPGLVRILITHARQTEEQNDCNADVTWSRSSWKTSSV